MICIHLAGPCPLLPGTKPGQFPRSIKTNKNTPNNYPLMFYP
jgi:hypothetical protein